MKPIREIDDPTPELFRSEILQAGEPVVFRGFVRDWPVVQAALDSDETYCNYIKAFDRGFGSTLPQVVRESRGIRLTPVSIEGDHSVSEILSFYMGKNTPRRREHIMNHLVVDLEMI